MALHILGRGGAEPGISTLNNESTVEPVLWDLCHERPLVLSVFVATDCF